MAKLQCNYPNSLDVLNVDRVAGDVVTSDSYDIKETAITQIEAELRRVTAKTGAATLTASEGGLILVSAAGAYSITLPTAVGNNGLTYFIIKTDDNANLVTIDGDTTETINGALTYTDLNYQYAYVAIRSDNANWFILYSSTNVHAQNADTDLDSTFEATLAKSGANGDITSMTGLSDDGIPIAKVVGAIADIVEDTSPQLGGQLQAGAHSINFTEQVLTSGTAVAWNLGISNKAILVAAHNPTITITVPTGALNAQVIITQDGTGSRVMDEIVTQSDAAIATTDVNITTEEITVTVDIPTGARIRFKTTAADLPAPLVVDTIYYAIRISGTVIKVATTKALAHAGTAINLTDVGTGTHTVQQLVKWTDGTLGVLSTLAGSEDILALTYKTADKQWYAVLNKGFA